MTCYTCSSHAQWIDAYIQSHLRSLVWPARDLIISHNPFLFTNMFSVCVCVCVCGASCWNIVFALEILLLCIRFGNIDRPVLDGELAYQVVSTAAAYILLCL